jgi:hypothetical protein
VIDTQRSLVRFGDYQYVGESLRVNPAKPLS